MKNQLTFAHVACALLDNKIKTYPQHRLVRDLFRSAFRMKPLTMVKLQMITSHSAAGVMEQDLFL